MLWGRLRRVTAIAGLLGAACALLAMAMPAWGASGGGWERAWGKDVVSGNAETGAEVCTVKALCKSGEDGSGDGEFSRPQDVAVAPNGDVFVADQFGGYIQVFGPAGNFIRRLGPYPGVNSLGIDGDGDVYITGTGPRILEVNSQGQFQRVWGKDVIAGNAETGPEICTVESQCQTGTQTEDNGSTLATEGGAFGYDNTVAVSPGGTVYVMEQGHSRISEFDSAGHFLRLWGKDVVKNNAETGAEVCTVSAQCKWGDSGTAGGDITSPWYGATDAAGNLYVANSGGESRVDEFAPSGAFIHAFGKNVDGGNPGTGYEVCTNAPDCLGGDRASTAGAFDSVIDVAVDASGNVYTAEDQNHRIQKFTAAGAFVSTWGKGVNGGSGLETCTAVNGCSGGALGGKGGEIDNTLPGIGADINGQMLYVTGPEGHRVQAFGARPPALASVSPASPANDNQPKLAGDAEEGATVALYADATCTGPVRGSGTAADFASPGLTVNVADNSTTTFYVKATAGGETSDCSSAGLTYVEDSSPPATPTITGTTPASPSDDEHPKVIGSAEAGSTVRLYTDAACGGTVAATGPAASFASPGLGVAVARNTDTTFFARSADAAGNVSGCSLGFGYQATRETTITSGPSGATNNSAPSFGFTADPSGGATFVCSVDHGSASPCSSPFTTGNLSDGSHEFEVAALSTGGTPDPTPATRTFVVDTVAPVTTIAVDTANPAAAKVDASASDAGSGIAAIGCVADPPAPPADVAGACPVTVTGAGDHVAYAISRDQAGNVSAPAQRAFTLGGAPDTTITEGPSGGTWVTTPLFAFKATAKGATFRCRVDGAPFAACPSPVRTFALKPGDHVFEVAAVGADGQVDPTPARRAFAVNATIRMDPLTCTIDSVPSDGDRGCQFTGSDIPYFDPQRCGRSDTCLPVAFTCPPGARCENYTEIHWTSADRNVWWTGSIHAQNTGPGYRPYDWSCQAQFNQRACAAWISTQVYAPTRLRSRCSASDASADHLPRPGEAAFGADSSRKLTCTIIWIIAPAAVLDAVATLSDVEINAPGPGALTVAPAPSKPLAPAASKRLAVIAKHRAKPLFKTVRAKVKRAGSVRVRIKLSRPARRKLRRRGRLPIRIRIRFAAAHGGAAQVRIERSRSLHAHGASRTSGRAAARGRRGTRFLHESPPAHSSPNASASAAVLKTARVAPASRPAS